MSRHITISEAFAQWSTDHGMGTPFQIHGINDHGALCESWNNFTDNLCKEGALNDLQYVHCPAWDDKIPEDTAEECEFLLEAMGFEISFVTVLERPDNLMNDSAHHYKFTILRNGVFKMQGFYSTGSAIEVPDGTDLFNCLLSDTSFYGDTFEEWVNEMGYDSDPRSAEKIYNACKEQKTVIESMLTKSELEDLREVFQDY